MRTSFGRRTFLQSAAAGATLGGLASLDFFQTLPRVSADEAKSDQKGVKFSPDIEPLVRLLEETPREAVLQRFAEKIHNGTTYREVVAALLLAGVRNVQPRPAVGFKFHAVLVVNSAHLASLSGPDSHRWLPIFWALDYFKDSQARDEREGNWTMAPVDESKVPPASKAREMFTEAMDNWDEEQADVAVAALARSLGSNELFEIFSRYGARDFRSIGHKAIYVANGFRALDTIGWQYSEPVLRSLAYALLNHEGQDNPAKNDYSNDRPWRENLKRVKEIRADWREGKVDEQATRDLLATLYAGSADDLCKQVVEVLNKGVSPQSVWDALLLGGGECLMRQPGIVGLHTLTTTNAMHYAYQTAASDETRRMLMLQNAAFLPMFREAMEGRGKVADAKIMDLEPAGSPADRTMLEKIFEEISRDRMEAARQTLAYARQTQSADAFVHQARALVFQKGRDSHDYKFSSAVLEDYRWVSPSLRDRFLAASVFNLRGSGGADNPLVERAKQALA